MDNCWDYNNGNSEIRMGKALRDGARAKVFLMTKIDGRTKQEAQKAMLEAKKAGKIRYIGFTGHKDPFILLRMLKIAAENHFHFDAVQMPLNVMDAHFRSFEDQVLPVLLKGGIGVEAMKTFGDNFILRSKTVQPIEALHYSMTLP